MSYDQQTNTNTGASNTGAHLGGQHSHIDPSSTFASGGLNNSTGREPFEDSTSTFAPTGVPAPALAGNLHEHGSHHHHGAGLTGSSGVGSSLNTQHNDHHLTSGSSGLNTGSGLGHQSGLNTGSGLGHQSHGSEFGRGDHLTNESRGDIKAGTAYDPAVSQGRNTGSGLHDGVVGQQTGDVYGGVQTGTGAYGTGRHVQQDENKGLIAKAKDAVTGNKDHSTTSTHDDDYNRRTVGHGAHVGTGLTGAHPAAGVTGAAGTSGRDNTYGSDTAARDYDNRTSTTGTGLTGGSHDHNTGLTGGSRDHNIGSHTGAVGSHDHGVTNSTGLTDSGTYGHAAGDKNANDHKLSGLTRHGDDFTRGDTADSAYSNPSATGLTGREHTTTGVHDQNLQGTGAHKEGIMDKIKNVVGGHKNTTHAETKH